MSAGFGWSVGDIILLTKLTHRVIHALKRQGGSSTQYQGALRSLDSLQATLNEIRSVLSTSELDFRNAVRAQAQLDDSSSSIADFHDRILRKYDTALGMQASDKALPKIWRKLTWAFDAAKDLTDFQTQLSMQLQMVELEMAKQQWWLAGSVTWLTRQLTSHRLRVSAINAITTASQERIRSLANESHSDHKLTLDRVEDARSRVASEVSDFRALFEMQNERNLEARKNNHTEIKTLLQGFSYDSAQISAKTQKIQVEHGQRLEDLSQIIEGTTRLPEDMQPQENKSLMRNYSEQAQQFLHIQRGIDEIKAQLAMSVQSKTTGTQARNSSGNASLSSSHAFLSGEIRRLSSLGNSSLATSYSFLFKEVRRLSVSWLLWFDI